MRAGGHNNLYFLLYHRALLADLEDAMAGVGCNFGLPYFDSGSIYNRMWDDGAWDALGNTTGCLENGLFAGMMLADGSCVNRQTDYRTVWAAATIRSSIESSGSYDEFSRNCENGPHAQVHNALGGCMANLYEAAGDPFFFLHHCWVDYLYANWQNLDPARYQDIGGQDPNARAPAFEDKYTLGMLADYQNNLCYEYASPSVVVGGAPPQEEGDDDDDNDDDNDDEDDLDPNGPHIAVPEDQLAEDAVIEEPPELSDEVLESFNLNADDVKQVHANLVDLTKKIHEYLKNGNIGELWDVLKEQVQNQTGGSNGTNGNNGTNGDDGTTAAGSDPNPSPVDSSSGVLTTSVAVIIAAFAFLF